MDSQLGAFVSRGSIVWGSEQLSGHEESGPASDSATDRQIHADTQNSLIPLLRVEQSNERMRSSARVGWIEGKQSSVSPPQFVNVLLFVRLVRRTAKPASMTVTESCHMVFCFAQAHFYTINAVCHD